MERHTLQSLTDAALHRLESVVRHESAVRRARRPGGGVDRGAVIIEVLGWLDPGARRRVTCVARVWAPSQTSPSPAAPVALTPRELPSPSAPPSAAAAAIAESAASAAAHSPPRRGGYNEAVATEAAATTTAPAAAARKQQRLQAMGGGAGAMISLYSLGGGVVGAVGALLASNREVRSHSTIRRRAEHRPLDRCRSYWTSELFVLTSPLSTGYVEQTRPRLNEQRSATKRVSPGA